MKRFVVIGLGNFGASVAEALHAQRNEVIAIDQHEEAVDKIAPHVTRSAVGDGRQLSVLERIGVKGADVGIVGTGDDITSSILATMALRDLGVKEIYVKVISRDHARVMDRIGVTDTIFPERDTALSLAQRLSSPSLVNFVRLGSGFSLQEMAVGERWQGKTLRQLRLRQRFGINVVALHDVLTDLMNPAPDPDGPLKDSDTLLLAGKDEDLARAIKES